jgi:hypothetical protein
MITSALRIAAVALAASCGCASAGGDPFFADVDSVHAGTSGTVRVTIDFARLLTLDRAATTVVIGNPGVAVAQLSDDRTIILTGKTAGATNLIALDAEGREVTNVVLEVVAAGGHVVTVHQGITRQTFACARRCDPVLSVGDDPELFNATAAQIAARQGFSGVAE